MFLSVVEYNLQSLLNSIFLISKFPSLICVDRVFFIFATIFKAFYRKKLKQMAKAVTTFKKGDCNGCDNFRGVKWVNTCYKLYTSVLANDWTQ